MSRALIKKIKETIQAWAKQYPQVELSVIEAYPSGIGENLHVIVVANKGFETWNRSERQDEIRRFLRQQLGHADTANIFLLLTFTEEEFDRYEITKPVEY